MRNLGPKCPKALNPYPASEPDPWTLLQMLEYMVRIWREDLRKNKSNAGTRLPVILPVVLHHGPSGWTAAQRFVEYYGAVPESLRQYVVDYGILIDDVGIVDPDELLVRDLTPEAKLVLLCLMLGRTPERFFKELQKWSELLVDVLRTEGENPVVVSALIVYLYRVVGVPKEETTMAVLNALKRAKMHPAEEILNAHEVVQEWYRQDRLHDRSEGHKEGRIKGRIEGRIEGELDGKRKTLVMQLEQRFGPVPHAITQRLQSATATELDDMVSRVLNAPTIEEVLGLQQKKSRSRRA